MRRIQIALFLALIAISPVAHGGVIIFDGGGPDQLDGFNMTDNIVAVDFNFFSDPGLHTVTDGHFWTLEKGTGTTTVLSWYLYSTNPGDGFSPLEDPVQGGQGIGVMVTKEPGMLGVVIGGDTYNEFKYSFDFDTPLVLPGQTRWWLGLNLGSSGLDVLWESTSSGPAYSDPTLLMPDQFGAFYQTGVGTAMTPTNLYLAFNLTGPSVPEPASLVLVGIGALGLLWNARRRKAS